jgi:hypothetical protein
MVFAMKFASYRVPADSLPATPVVYLQAAISCDFLASGHCQAHVMAAAAPYSTSAEPAPACCSTVPLQQLMPARGGAVAAEAGAAVLLEVAH